MNVSKDGQHEYVTNKIQELYQMTQEREAELQLLNDDEAENDD